MLNDAIRIAEYLRNFQAAGGIVDPLEARVIPFSYTTSFYALLSAYLYLELCDETWKKCCEEALNSELKIIEKEQTTKESLRVSAMNDFFHWEFKNYSLVNLYEIMKKTSRNDLYKRLENVTLRWRNTGINSTNWRAMRAYSHYKRFRLLGVKKDLIRSRLELAMVLESQTKEGLFPDTRNSFSLQYHAYILSLLFQLFRESRNHDVWKGFIKGVDFLLDFIDSAGDFAYYGRGQQQIFGYGSLIFSLVSAAAITSKSSYLRAAERVYMYLKKFKENNLPPLCLNNQGNKLGWYYYNHYGDYLSFLGVYLLQSYFGYPRTVAKQELTSYPSRCTIFYPQLGFLIAKRNKYFISISAGGESTAQIAGIMHIRPKILPCTGGPYDGTGPNDYSMNYLGPVYNGNPIMNRTGQIGYCSDIAKLKFDLDDLLIEYIYKLQNGIRIKLRLTPRKKIRLIPLHLCAFEEPIASIPIKRCGKIPTPDGWAACYEAEPITLSTQKVIELQVLSGTFSTPISEERNIKMYTPKRKKTSKYLVLSLVNFLIHKFDQLWLINRG